MHPPTGTLWQASNLTNIEYAMPCDYYLPASLPGSPPTEAAAAPYRRSFCISEKEIETLNIKGIVVITDTFSQDQLSDMRKVV